MVRSIEKKSKSLLVKVLVGIIILPFLFWGMGDIFRGGNQNIVATIDNEKISTKEFINYVNRLNLSEQERNNIKKTNLLERILSDYTGRKIIALEVKSMGINVSDRSLKNIIINDKTFFKNNKFSRTEYEKFLLKSALSAPVFEKNIIEQEKKRQLLSYLSSGVTVPIFLINEEFNKENQIKTIEYINLNNFYKKKILDKEKVKKIYKENKDVFVEIFKNITFVELNPDVLTGQNKFNENFFNKISKIENNLLDGKNIKEIAEENNLKIIETGEINKKRINTKGVKIKNIDEVLFNKAFKIQKENYPELYNIDNKYYLTEIIKIKIKNKDINDKEVLDAIHAQIKIMEKIENNTKIVKDISSGDFNLNKMQEFAKEHGLQIKQAEITTIKNNTVFSEALVKRIFAGKDGEIDLITDSLLSKNFIIYSKKTLYKKLETDSDLFKNYEAKAKIDFAKNIYQIYDKSLNAKYKVSINKKTIDRIKNSF